MADRPKHQRWIKRPPKPSRAAPAREARVRPGMTQFLLACGIGLIGGVIGALLGPQIVPGRAGMAGLFAGLGFAATFLGVWRALGGTRDDIRELFR
jgi:hypothetical protein